MCKIEIIQQKHWRLKQRSQGYEPFKSKDFKIIDSSYLVIIINLTMLIQCNLLQFFNSIIIMHYCFYDLGNAFKNNQTVTQVLGQFLCSKIGLSLQFFLGSKNFMPVYRILSVYYFFYSKLAELQQFFNMMKQIYWQPVICLSPNKSQPDTESDQTQYLTAPLTHTFSLQHSSKLKSSLCKNFSLQGYCPYDSKCRFAHGPQQLRCNAIVNTCYKTKPCFSFLEKGHCPYGHRCNFIHREINKAKALATATVQNFPQLIMTAKREYESKFLKKLMLK